MYKKPGHLPILRSLQTLERIVTCLLLSRCIQFIQRVAAEIRKLSLTRQIRDLASGGEW